MFILRFLIETAESLSEMFISRDLIESAENDTKLCNDYLDYLSEYEAICETALVRESVS
jgi:hypothetical protein